MLTPLLAVVLSNADLVFLAATGPLAGTAEITFALLTTIPLSIGASVLTLWFLLRLRREVDQRAIAERDLRASHADLAKALDRERLLLRELDHRVRNNLAALLSLVGMYEDAETTSADIVISFRNRILALRESYGLIASTQDGDGIELSKLLHAVVAAVLGHDGARTVTIEGPSVKLTSRESNAFAMIAQELLTNAAKHGALRHDAGIICITWQSSTQVGETCVSLRWIERPVALTATAPAAGQSGLGLSLIQGFAASDLCGGVSYKRSDDQWIVDLIANVKTPHPEVNTGTHKEICV